MSYHSQGSGFGASQHQLSLEKACRLGASRHREKPVRGGAFEQPAAVQEQDLVGQTPRLAQIVDGHHDLGPGLVDRPNELVDRPGTLALYDRKRYASAFKYLSNTP